MTFHGPNGEEITLPDTTKPAAVKRLMRALSIDAANIQQVMKLKAAHEYQRPVFGHV